MELGADYRCIYFTQCPVPNGGGADAYPDVPSDLICQACAEACARCGEACEAHPEDAHMKKCAEECRKCEKACREMLEHVKKGGAAKTRGAERK